jgi:hypothetical protein
MAKQFTKEELANLPKTPYAAFGDFLASSTSNLFSPTRVNPIRGAGMKGQIGALGKTSQAPLPQASTTYNPFATALQKPQSGIKSPMPFATFAEQQDALATPFNPFLTTGTFGDIGDVGIKSDASPMPSSESTQMPTPSAGSVTSTRPLDATNAQNTAQRAEQTSNSLMDAWSSIQSISREGMPVLGSSDLKVKRDVYGRPYTVVSMTPTDEQGRSQKTETLSFGISPETKERQGGSMAPSYQQTRQKPEQQALQNPEQIAELRRRQQLGMSGRGMAGSMASEPTATGTIVPPRPEGAKEMPAISPMSPMASKEAARTAQRWDAAEKAAIQGIKKKYGV